MQSMRRFFVRGRSTICVFDDANRQSLPREGVAALPYTEWVSCPSSGQAIQILRVGADRRVRPHRLALQFESNLLSGGYPYFKQPLVGAGLCACPGYVMRLCDEGRPLCLPA
jgi:hypothetical protein